MRSSAGAWTTSGRWSPRPSGGIALQRAGVPPFEQNARIDLPNGRWVIVDFLWRRLRAVLEIDSIEHHSSPPDADGTSDRHLVLESLGFGVVHRTPRFVTRQTRAFVIGITVCGLTGWPSSKGDQVTLSHITMWLRVS